MELISWRHDLLLLLPVMFEFQPHKNFAYLYIAANFGLKLDLNE